LRATLLQQQQAKIEVKIMEDIAQKLSSCDIIAQLCSSPRKEKVLIVQEILQRNNLLLLGIFIRH
jgi:hypothetical protein